MKKFSVNDYVCPTWACWSAHVQTIVPAKLARKPSLSYDRERWDTPDGDFIDADWVGPKTDGDPIVVLFHGLEGSSRSHYALSLMNAVEKKGWSGCVAHFRSCSGELNRLPRAYYAGDTDEHEWIFKMLRKRFPHSPIFAAGVSLGGCQVALFASRCADLAKELIRASAAVSAPVDLIASNKKTDSGLSKIYIWNFLRTLKPKTIAKFGMFPELNKKFDLQAIKKCTNLVEFDSLYTAPMHGFRDAYDYWSQSSPKPWLRKTGIPLLLLNAQNDPFYPKDALPSADEVNNLVTLDYPDMGGHVGFPLGCFPGSLNYVPSKILGFFECFL